MKVNAGKNRCQPAALLPPLREIARLVANAEPEELASLARGLIDKMVVDGDTLTVHYAFNKPEEPDLVVQLWLPGQVAIVTLQAKGACPAVLEAAVRKGGNSQS